MTVRGRTISPRLRPVEKGGTELIQPSRRLVAVPLPEEGQRFRAASRVPSTSKTIRAAPSRSTRPPGCRSFESGWLSRSSRTWRRKASTGSWVSAVKKRESVERAGSRSRSNNAHVGYRNRLQPLVEGFQGAFPTDRRAKEDRQKVDHDVSPETSPRKTHALTELAQDALLAQMLDEEHHLAQPRGGRGNRVRKGLDDHRRIDDTVHICLLCEEAMYSSSLRRPSFLLMCYCSSRCARRGRVNRREVKQISGNYKPKKRQAPPPEPFEPTDRFLDFVQLLDPLAPPHREEVLK